MKDKYLLSACMIWVFLWIEVMWVKVLFIIMCSIIYHKRHVKLVIWTILLCCFIQIHDSYIKMEHLPSSGTYKVLEIKSSYVIATNGKSKVILYGVKDAVFHDVYALDHQFQKIDTNHNEHGFVFSKWLAKKGIYYSTYIKDAHLIKEGSSIKSALYKKVLKHQHTNLMKQLLYGIQDKDTTSYLVIASGMHISFCISILKKILDKWIDELYAQWICVIIVLILGNLFVFTISILRILCFYIVQIIWKEHDVKDCLGISMILMLCMAPYAYSEISFVLPVCFRLVYIFKQKKCSNIFLSFIVLCPLQLLYFQSFDIIQFLFYRILRISYGMLYILALCMFILPIPQIVLSSLMSICHSLEAMHFIWYGAVSKTWIFVWFYIVFCYLTYFKWKYLLYLGGCILYFFIAPYINPFAQVYILDVGQGDCALIILPFKQEVVMIDVVGHKSRNIPEESIIPFLHAKKITHIDTLIITHHDLDHDGGLAQLQEYITIGNIIDTKEKAKLEKDSWIQYLLLDYEGEDENENSIITYFQLHNLRFLFMGDLGKQGELKLLQAYPHLQAEVLKVGHHGSKTSSSLSFLHQIHPMIGCISSGRNNYYGHPHKEVVEALQKENILMLNTAEKGSISIKTSSYFSIIKTAKQDISILFHFFKKD